MLPSTRQSENGKHLFYACVEETKKMSFENIRLLNFQFLFCILPQPSFLSSLRKYTNKVWFKSLYRKQML